MRALTLMVVAMLGGCAPFLAAAQDPKVVMQKDEFTGERGVVLSDMAIQSRQGPTFIVIGHSAPGASVTNWMLLPVTGKRGWSYLECHSLDLVADGIRLFPFGEVDHHGEVTETGVRERISFSMLPDTVRALATAKVAKGRVCHDDFEFGDKHKKAMLDLLSMAAAPPPSAPDPPRQ